MILHPQRLSRPIIWLWMTAVVTGIAPAPRAQLAEEWVDAREIRRVVAPIVEQVAVEQGPGCAVSVTHDGHRLFRRSFGLANLEHDIPITPHTAFHLASTSKQFTAAGVLLLAEEGRLSLGDRVDRFFPELAPAPRPIEIRHLLHHTSGIRDYSVLLQLSGIRLDKDAVGPGRILETILRQQSFAFAAGDRFEYSNSNYWLLAEIVERVSGQSFRSFLRDRLFEPLGMHNTTVQVDVDEWIPRRATGYSRRPEGGFRIRQDRTLSFGDGGIFTTLDDLELWAKIFLSEAEGLEGMVREMLRPGSLASGDEVPYGGGVEIAEQSGHLTYSHSGYASGYRAELLLLPQESLAVLALCNLTSVRPEALALSIAEAVTTLLRRPVPTPAAGGGAERPSVLAPGRLPPRLFGTFRRPGGAVFEFTEEEGGSLVGRINGGGDFHLRRLGELSYVIVDSPGETFQVVESTAGEAKRIEYRRSEEAKPDLFERVLPLQTDLVVDLVGRYESEDLGVGYEIHASRGLLSLHVVETASRRLGPLVERPDGSFTSGGVGTYEFLRDQNGRVEAMALDVPRIGRLLLTKIDQGGD